MSSVVDALRVSCNQFGDPLAGASESGPLLIVFLRHFGCALCREMVADVARQRKALAAAGLQVVFVHMHPEAMAAEYFAGYGLEDIWRVSDPERHLYTAFGLERVRPSHWVSWPVLRRYIDAIFRGGHRPGYVGGNVLQMPGAFVVHRGAIRKTFRPASVSERFDAIAFVS
jgi:hypothetical protein